MSSINRKSFIAELRSLLSFMDPADRQMVLRKYESMFDEAGPEGEEALIARFGSPVRQVLRIERQYRESLKRREEAMARPDAQTESVPELAVEPMPEEDEEAENAREEIDLFAPEEPESEPERPETEPTAEYVPAESEPGSEISAEALPTNEPEKDEVPAFAFRRLGESDRPERNAPTEDGPEADEPQPEAVLSEPESDEESDEEPDEEPDKEPTPEDVAVARWLNAVENGLDAGIVPEMPTEEEERAEEPKTLPYAAREIGEETFAGEDDRSELAPTAEKSKPGGGHVFAAILVTVPMIAFVALGVVLSVALALAFMAIGAFFGVACIYLCGYVFGGRIGFMPDLLLTGGAALVLLALAVLLMWTGIWLGVGGCMLTVRITAAVYRSVLHKEKGGASHG